MKIEKISISKIKANPSNPRIIRDDKFQKLVQSIKDFPEMLKIRPIVLNKEMIILGGNMRFRAATEAGLKELPVIVVDLTKEQQDEFIIKDNVSGGEWDWDALANTWNVDLLEKWGLDIPSFEPEQSEGKEKIPDEAFFINIRCDDESHCQKLYEKFIKQGLDVKIVT